jgi:hypothetical protein
MVSSWVVGSSRKFGMTKFEKTPRELVSPAIQKDLLTLEEQEVLRYA